MKKSPISVIMGNVSCISKTLGRCAQRGLKICVSAAVHCLFCNSLNGLISSHYWFYYDSYTLTSQSFRHLKPPDRMHYSATTLPTVINSCHQFLWFCSQTEKRSVLVKQKVCRSRHVCLYTGCRRQFHLCLNLKRFQHQFDDVALKK